MVLHRETLPYARAADLDASIRSVALDLIDDLDSARLEVVSSPSKARPFSPEEFRGFLERVSEWDSAAWFAHREHYLATYGPMPFIPPDCPTALVLQATLGNAEGRAFGRGRAAEHYVRPLEEFREHARAVSRLVGRRVAQHRGVFLGGADVLRRPLAEVLDDLQAIGQVFSIGAERPRVATPGEGWDDFATNLGPVHAFLDDFRGPLPDLGGWRKLRGAHLGQVTLGVESGDSLVRSTFDKSWEDDELRTIVVDLKAAGIGVGLVVLAGAGGRGAADRHLDATASLLGSLPLEAGDLVTLVDARSLDETSGDGPGSLSDDETVGQIAALKQKVAAGRPSKGPKLVVYNPEKRWA